MSRVLILTQADLMMKGIYPAFLCITTHKRSWLERTQQIWWMWAVRSWKSVNLELWSLCSPGIPLVSWVCDPGIPGHSISVCELKEWVGVDLKLKTKGGVIHLIWDTEVLCAVLRAVVSDVAMLQSSRVIISLFTSMCWFTRNKTYIPNQENQQGKIKCCPSSQHQMMWLTLSVGTLIHRVGHLTLSGLYS